MVARILMFPNKVGERAHAAAHESSFFRPPGGPTNNSPALYRERGRMFGGWTSEQSRECSKVFENVR
jgi:hypothetical protein